MLDGTVLVSVVCHVSHFKKMVTTGLSFNAVSSNYKSQHLSNVGKQLAKHTVSDLCSQTFSNRQNIILDPHKSRETSLMQL